MQIENIRSLFLALEVGSITAAALRLGVPASTVSRRIRELEQQVGTELVVRSGRGVTVPRDAVDRLERLRDVLDAVEAALAVPDAGRRQLKTLRMTVPLEMSLSLVPDVVAAFVRRYPRTAFELHGERRRVALIEEDFDLAIRIGRLDDTSLLGTDLGPIPMVLALPPGPAPLAPGDLVSIPAVEVMGAGRPLSGHWNGSPVSIELPVVARVSSFTAAVELVARGVGLCVSPLYAVAAEVERGAVQVVPSFGQEPARAYALYPRRHRDQPVVRELVSALRDALAAGELALPERSHSA